MSSCLVFVLVIPPAKKLLTRRPFNTVFTVHFVQKVHFFGTHDAVYDTFSTCVRAVRKLSIFGNEEVGSSNLLISSSKKAVPKGTAFLLEKINIYVSAYPEAPIVMKGFFDGAQSAAK